MQRVPSGVTVTVLGCSGSHFDEELRVPCSSYLIECSEGAVLLECGFGSYESYRRFATDVLLDALFVSHAHADHVADLQLFLDDPRLWRDRPRLVGSSATLEVIAPASDTLVEGSLVMVSEDTSLRLPFVEATFSLTAHQIPTLAVTVLLGGRRLVFSGDTGPTWTAPSAFLGADLAILECTLEKRNTTSSSFHLDAAEVGRLSKDLSVARTLITHVPPRESGETRLHIAHDVAPKVEFSLAYPGLRMDL